MERAFFRILGFRMRVEGPAGALAPLAFAYARFAVEEGEADGWLRIDPDRGAVETDRGCWRLVEAIDPTEQAYPRFLSRVYDGIGHRAIAHAGCSVRPDGGAALFAAPAGHGKSTLTLQLAVRGWTLFSDDFAPLDLASGSVEAFPRAVGVVPESPFVPQPFAGAAARSTRTLFGKRLVDPGCVAVGSPRDSAPLEHVFVLRGAEEDAPRLEITYPREERERIGARLGGIEGARVVGRAGSHGLETLVLVADPGSHAASPLSELASDPAVLFSSTHWSRPAGFDEPACCLPLPRREAAALLGRELLNRRPGGSLLQRYGGDPVLLMLDLASALRRTHCWALTPGTPADTADLVERVVSNGDASR